MEIARSFEEKAYYRSAHNYYVAARRAYLEEENPKKAMECRWKIFDMEKIIDTYSIAEDKLYDEMKKYNESYTTEDLAKWLQEDRLVKLIMDGGEPWYYESCFTNLSYSYPDVMERDVELQKRIDMFAGIILNFLQNRSQIRTIHSNPRRFEASQQLSVPRDRLPETGLLKVWFPFPIETHAQREIEIIAIAPEQFWKQGPDINADIGCVYFEIPLEQLDGDLIMEVGFRFTHYETNYDINPEDVGEYDTGSDLYKKYTRSTTNTMVTQEIREKAWEIVGNETNPYRQVQLIQKYMLDNIKYGLAPHIAQYAMGIPISVFVNNDGYGDCGAQAIYFSALCRGVGIPARATGGYELLIPNGSSHFWAEFYLPNYGWIPFDPSLAVVASLSQSTTIEERELIIDYLFGNMDPFRLIFQNDTDIDLIPPGDEPPVTTIAFQIPMAECPEMEQNPTIVMLEYFRWSVRPVDM